MIVCVPPRATSPPVVTVSIPPLGAIVRDVGGGFVTVHDLLSPGASPHHYEPGPEGLRAASRGVVHFVVGRGLDGWAEQLARGVSAPAWIVRLGSDLPGPEPPGEHGGHGHGPDGHHPSDEGDPHVWMDPWKAAVIAERVGETLALLLPERADTLVSRGRAAAARYRVLGEEMGEELAPIRDRPFATYHGGLNHMVARYGLRQVAVLTEFPGQEPTPRQLRETVLAIRRSKAQAVFSEPQSSSKLAHVVGRETETPVHQIDVHGLSGGRTYEDLIRTCVAVFVQALGRSEAK